MCTSNATSVAVPEPSRPSAEGVAAVRSRSSAGSRLLALAVRVSAVRPAGLGGHLGCASGRASRRLLAEGSRVARPWLRDPPFTAPSRRSVEGVAPLSVPPSRLGPWGLETSSNLHHRQLALSRRRSDPRRDRASAREPSSCRSGRLAVPRALEPQPSGLARRAFGEQPSSMGFVALRRLRRWAATCSGVASPGYAASSGFLNPSTLCSAHLLSGLLSCR